MLCRAMTGARVAMVSGYVMLCHDTSGYVMLCYVMSCYVMLCHVLVSPRFNWRQLENVMEGVTEEQLLTQVRSPCRFAGIRGHLVGFSILHLQ